MIFIIALGVLFIGTAAEMAARRYRMLRRGIRVAGIVADLEADGVGSDTLYRPILAFTTQTGEEIRTNAAAVGWTNTPRLKPGQQVWVVYDYDNPRKATIAAFTTLDLIVVSFALVGIGIIGMSFLLPIGFWGGPRN